MRMLLAGVVLGGVCGYLVRYSSTEDATSRAAARTAEQQEERARTAAPATDDAELDRLRGLVAKLRAQLAARGPEAEEPLGDLAIPQTDEEIELFLDEFQRTNDLDRLLAVIRALLLQGERGYPRLTQVLLRFMGKAMARGFDEEDLLQRVVPAMKLALHHEKELVGYVGYLLAADDVPAPFRTGAMAAAMFLSVNGVKGSESFAPHLLEQFLKISERGGGGGLFGDDPAFLVQAMGFLRQRDAVDPLLRILKDPEQAKLHRAAVESLGRIGDPSAVGPLVQRLRGQDSNQVWWTPELRALARIGTPEATAAAEEYLAGIQSNDRFFGQAGSYLREAPSEKVVEMVRGRFRNNPRAQNLWSVVYGLQHAGTPAALELLEEIAGHGEADPNVRRQAQNLLEERRKLQEQLER